jgi:hypothetical protein
MRVHAGVGIRASPVAACILRIGCVLRTVLLLALALALAAESSQVVSEPVACRRMFNAIVNIAFTVPSSRINRKSMATAGPGSGPVYPSEVPVGVQRPENEAEIVREAPAEDRGHEA